MKANLSLSLVILIFFSSCSNKGGSDIVTQESGYPIKIDLIEAISNKKDIKLSDIADSIAYIPLEFVKDNPLGYIFDYNFFPENIFIEGGNHGAFFRFDGKGKFLNEISKMGRGPGEYLSGSTSSVINNPDRFYILCNFVPRRILEYDYNGNFLSEVMVADPAVGKFEAISPERFLFLSSSDTSFHYLASLNDRSNKLLMMVPHPLFANPKIKELKGFLFGGAVSGVYFEGMPLFFDGYSMDTIYSIRNDSIYPKYILDKGTEGAPFEKIYVIPEVPRNKIMVGPERWNYLCPISLCETQNDVYIMVIFGEELYLMDYNKKTQSVSSIKTPFILPDDPKQPIVVSPKFENDIDGGISLGPGKPNIDGDIWTYTFDAINFKNQLTKEHFLDSKALYPEKKKALMRLVDTVKDEDNPIIMVIYLKKSSQ